VRRKRSPWARGRSAGYPIRIRTTRKTSLVHPERPDAIHPLQAKEGDYAIFLREQGVEVEFEEIKYLIVPQSAVLMIVRKS